MCPPRPFRAGSGTPPPDHLPIFSLHVPSLTTCDQHPNNPLAASFVRTAQAAGASAVSTRRGKMFHLMQLRCPACAVETALKMLRNRVVCLECGWAVESLLQGIHAHQQLATNIEEKRRVAERGLGAVLALVDTGLINQVDAVSSSSMPGPITPRPSASWSASTRP